MAPNIASQPHTYTKHANTASTLGLFCDHLSSISSARCVYLKLSHIRRSSYDIIKYWIRFNPFCDDGIETNITLFYLTHVYNCFNSQRKSNNKMNDLILFGWLFISHSLKTILMFHHGANVYNMKCNVGTIFGYKKCIYISLIHSSKLFYPNYFTSNKPNDITYTRRQILFFPFFNISRFFISISCATYTQEKIDKKRSREDFTIY